MGTDQADAIVAATRGTYHPPPTSEMGNPRNKRLSARFGRSRGAIRVFGRIDPIRSRGVRWFNYYMLGDLNEELLWCLAGTSYFPIHPPLKYFP